jgi:hypothetical protein
MKTYNFRIKLEMCKWSIVILKVIFSGMVKTRAEAYHQPYPRERIRMVDKSK